MSPYNVHWRANVRKDAFRNQVGRVTCPVDVSQAPSLAISMVIGAIDGVAMMAGMEAVHGSNIVGCL